MQSCLYIKGMVRPCQWKSVVHSPQNTFGIPEVNRVAAIFSTTGKNREIVLHDQHNLPNTAESAHVCSYPEFKVITSMNVNVPLYHG